jgi:hypothetical protein
MPAVPSAVVTDLAAVKTRQQAAWSTGNNALLPSEYLEIVIERK